MDLWEAAAGYSTDPRMADVGRKLVCAGAVMPRPVRRGGHDKCEWWRRLLPHVHTSLVVFSDGDKDPWRIGGVPANASAYGVRVTNAYGSASYATAIGMSVAATVESTPPLTRQSTFLVGPTVSRMYSTARS